jgi:hypothetical protein
MFMRQQNSIQSFRSASDGGEAFADLPARKSGVDEKTGLACFKIGAIAAGTAAKNSKLH